MADIRIAESVAKRINDLDEHEKERVKEKIRQAAKNPEHYLKPLRGRDDYSLRVGDDYRVILDWDKNDDVLYVTDFGKRDGIYD
jgi:mRNA interferase RelE/StbE